MKHLVIIGAGGFGREVYWSAKESVGYGSEFEIKGFLDSNEHILDAFPNYPPILGVEDTYEIESDDIFVCAVGDVRLKKKCCETILNRGGHFFNLVHKDAYIGENTHIGVGCIFLALSRVHCDVSIGDFVTVQPYSVIGHDVKVGNWCQINDYSDCGGASEIGNEVTINTHSFIFPRVKVGDRATIGAGSFVLRNVKEGVVVFGNPAKPLPLPKAE